MEEKHYRSLAGKISLIVVLGCLAPLAPVAALFGAELWRSGPAAVFISLACWIAITLGAVLVSRRLIGRFERERGNEGAGEQVVEPGNMASVGELAAGIAHEINNPVAVMVEEAGWIEDLLEEEEFAHSENLKEFRRALRQIATQGERIKGITHKLLSFAHRTDPTVRSFDIHELIREAIVTFERTSRLANVRIETDFSDSPPLLSASPSELRQVFINLIGNGIDAIGPEGGTIEIRTRVEGGELKIDVSDTGHGIPPKILPRIFDPFFTTRPVGKGTGLGLSICYGIIKRLGGRIGVNSSAGKGSTFHIQIPLPESAGTQDPAQGPVPR